MTGLALDAFTSLATLPAPAAQLLDEIGSGALFSSRPWFETFVTAGMRTDASPMFLVLGETAGATRAILPCQRIAGGDPAVCGLTSFYSCDFRPLIAPGEDAFETARELGRQVGECLSDEAVVAFDSLAASLPALGAFFSGLKVRGRAILRYDHFGRWWENVTGLTFTQYLAARDGALRELVRRKGARLERAGATFVMIDAASGPDAVERGIAEYETVYRASWKEPEPFPNFQPALMRNLAKVGWLRLALCRMDGHPIAAQLWAQVGGTATVLKLAHDQAHDALSPGTVLTAFAIRALMDGGNVSVLDFGRGDDGYKRVWAGNRTQHTGVMSVSAARRPLLIARHFAGRGMRRLRGGDSSR